jgi:acyl-CoA reductase-like NAD-dependent aldehyde dehydrogenase
MWSRVSRQLSKRYRGLDFGCILPSLNTSSSSTASVADKTWMDGSQARRSTTLLNGKMSREVAATIKASILDGIALTPRFRERNLASLQSTIVGARVEALDVIQQTSGATHEEALFEYLLTLNAIKTFHSNVHPQSCRDAEYQIAKSKDHPDQRRPYGYVHVMLGEIDGFYAVIVAVAAALAAGNCIILQQHDGTSSPSLVEKLLTQSLSSEVFALVSNDPLESSLREKHGVLLRSLAEEQFTGTTVQGSVGHSIAIVDRTADMKVAARDCVHARFAFGGRSAYAPDFVMVNEFFVKDFASAVAQTALQYLAGHANGPVDEKSAKANDRHSKTSTQALEQNGTVLASGDKGRVVLLHKRDNGLLSTKTTSPTLIIVPISSVDDAIDWLNSTLATPLAASYIYSSPEFAKYTGQFIRTSLLLVNHIPPELLVGPPAPLTFAASIQPRYTPEMFSTPSPAYIERSKSPHLAALNDAIWPDSTKKPKKLEDLIDINLKPVKEPFGPVVGFFEQGFLLGASLILSSAIVTVVLGVKAGWWGYSVLSR